MERISEQLAEFINEKVQMALEAKDQQLKHLEAEKAKLIRLVSELKQQVKSTQTTVAMFEKQMANPSRPLKKVEHKCVSCDIIDSSPSLASRPSSNTASTNGDCSMSKAALRTSRIQHSDDDTDVINDRVLVKGEPVDIKTLDEDTSKMDTSSSGPSLSFNSNLQTTKLDSQACRTTPIQQHTDPFAEPIISSASSFVPSTSSPINASTFIQSSEKENGSNIQIIEESTSHQSKKVEVIDLSDGENSPEESVISAKKTPLPPTIQATAGLRNEVNDQVKVAFSIIENPANESDEYAKVVKYEIFMHSLRQSDGLVRKKRSLGTVYPLPGQSGSLYFTANHLAPGYDYFFSVCPIDEFNRAGEFSEECWING